MATFIRVLCVVALAASVHASSSTSLQPKGLVQIVTDQVATCVQDLGGRCKSACGTTETALPVKEGCSSSEKCCVATGGTPTPTFKIPTTDPESLWSHPVIKAGRIGYGCDHCDKDVVTQALEAGFRIFDLATSYDNDAAIGEAFGAKLGDGNHGTVKREDVLVVYKIPVQTGGDHALKVARLVTAALAKLKIGYFDVLMLHDTASAEEDVVATLLAAKALLKTKTIYVGVSNIQSPAQLERLNEAYKEDGERGFDAIENKFNGITATPNEQAIKDKASDSLSMTVFAYKAVPTELQSHKYVGEATKTANTYVKAHMRTYFPDSSDVFTERDMLLLVCIKDGVVPLFQSREAEARSHAVKVGHAANLPRMPFTGAGSLLSTAVRTFKDSAMKVVQDQAEQEAVEMSIKKDVADAWLLKLGTCVDKSNVLVQKCVSNKPDCPKATTDLREVWDSDCAPVLETPPVGLVLAKLHCDGDFMPNKRSLQSAVDVYTAYKEAIFSGSGARACGAKNPLSISMCISLAKTEDGPNYVFNRFDFGFF